jgi:hypothetical protein
MSCCCGTRRVQEVIIVTRSAFFVAETVVATITHNMIAGRRYWVGTDVGITSETDNDLVVARIRNTNILGGEVTRTYLRVATAANVVRAFRPVLGRTWVPVASGPQTFVVTLDLVVGVGRIRLEALGNYPTHVYIDWMR